MTSGKLAILALLLAASLAACDSGSTPAPTAAPALSLQSEAFAGGAPIPRRYTCDGDDISPPLSWAGVPTGTRSLALIVDDPDAPAGTWVHWILFDIPPATRSLPAAIPAVEAAAGAGIHGRNSWQRLGYGGPCPPAGSEHHYQFRLYALDATLDLQPGATAKEVTTAMEGHILARGDLTALYAR